MEPGSVHEYINMLLPLAHSSLRHLEFMSQYGLYVFPQNRNWASYGLIVKGIDNSLQHIYFRLFYLF